MVKDSHITVRSAVGRSEKYPGHSRLKHRGKMDVPMPSVWEVMSIARDYNWLQDPNYELGPRRNTQVKF